MHTPTCNNRLKSQCQVQCSSETIMDLITVPNFEGSVLVLSQFWIFFVIVCVFWISQAAVYCLGDSICFDLLGKS